MASQSQVPVIELTDRVANHLADSQRSDAFGEILSSDRPRPFVVGPGDAIEISVWEAPPAALFGTGILDPRGGLSVSRQTTFPDQTVNADGRVNVPFAGMITVDGHTPEQIQEEVVSRLRGKANQPEALVRVTRNATQNVTVVGEVSSSTRMPLTPKGERLLDALAAAGGARQPISKVTLQLSRGGRVLAMPLERVIQDPKQNIYLHPGDVITALFQSSSFTALGAAGKNEEINFEAQGISLAQALGRMAGLRDNQADAQGVFIFRFEEPSAIAKIAPGALLTPDGRVPVVYQVDLKDPRTFLVAQAFPMKNKDVVYVANATGAELQKFLNILTSSIFSINTLINLGR